MTEGEDEVGGRGTEYWDLGYAHGGDHAIPYSPPASYMVSRV